MLKEFGIKGCKEARFAHGGQAFAAVNGTTAQLHATYTCESLGIIRLHSSFCMPSSAIKEILRNTDNS